MKAFQDNYPDSLAHCYGCGAHNPAGHHFQTFWEGDGTITRFTPESQHTAIPGFVYGGLVASLIDCHYHRLCFRSGRPRARGRTDPGDDTQVRYSILASRLHSPDPDGKRAGCKGCF